MGRRALYMATSWSESMAMAPLYLWWPGSTSPLHQLESNSVYFVTLWQWCGDFTKQGGYKKTCEFDRIIRCEVNQTTNYKDQQVTPDQIMIVEDMLSLHTPDDVRQDSQGELHSMTDILILDIRDRRNNII